MNVDLTTLNNLTLILTAFSAAFIAALWLSLIIWNLRDIKSRTKDILFHILSMLIVAVLFLPGIVIYLILRPANTIEQEYQKSLEEEALLQSIEENPLCPGCNRRIKETWIACPNCHIKLKKKCEQCDGLLDLPWNLCPHCASPVAGTQRETDGSPAYQSMDDFSLDFEQ
ncbi:MAG: zinc ribbon domain-containing protein [Anaerolineaceae bacterium]|nr:zinc ribbon domain-containing protein [Anaerolineaceae bacterium]